MEPVDDAPDDREEIPRSRIECGILNAEQRISIIEV